MTTVFFLGPSWGPEGLPAVMQAVVAGVAATDPSGSRRGVPAGTHRYTRSAVGPVVMPGGFDEQPRVAVVGEDLAGQIRRAVHRRQGSTRGWILIS